jgi:hypothetical protein
VVGGTLRSSALCMIVAFLWPMSENGHFRKEAKGDNHVTEASGNDTASLVALYMFSDGGLLVAYCLVTFPGVRQCLTATGQLNETCPGLSGVDIYQCRLNRISDCTFILPRALLQRHNWPPGCVNPGVCRPNLDVCAAFATQTAHQQSGELIRGTRVHTSMPLQNLYYKNQVQCRGMPGN